jgi:hypothetical protein
MRRVLEIPGGTSIVTRHCMLAIFSRPGKPGLLQS